MRPAKCLRLGSPPPGSLAPARAQAAALRQPIARTISTTSNKRPHPSPSQLPGRLQAPYLQPHRRSFGLPSLSSFLPSGGGDNGNNSPKRVLTANRTLPYSPELLFKVISSVESYSQFLPFLNASTVTARDPETGYPTQAFLTVGYGPLSETFTSRVDCDPAKGIVEARSGARYEPKDGGSSASGLFPGANEGIFEYLSTKWELAPVVPGGKPGGPQTKVQLEVRFEFRNQLHATLMGAVEGQMAGLMIEAFEKRIRALHEGQ
ncbi:hypothetical protein N7468_006789 [Penicillium chermesinum]|uniref:Coenzyme Q-binding protein COQ10 START domain-containing protein n=1 Tax=Penicillium chermesinum TaxID=63820 RepID=A0A9W9NVP4_9EURO|nr:uncharacterized protein N7468_006789 [Penicillium chermesinum]KAJ5225564.1 hypothetical protein N7468_006789 [Penicillium chermesinum]